MSTALAGSSAPARYRDFVAAVFAPRVYVTYGVLWALAYEAAAVLAAGGTWRPSWASAARAATVVAILLCLRLADERMDESYDRAHHPDRPLVTGLVTVTEVRRAGWLLAAVVVIGNAALAPWSALAATGLFGYVELLVRLEPRLPVLRDNPLLHLVVAFPVQLAIGVYLYASATATGVTAPGPRPVLLVPAFAAAFLHYEFARKTVRNPAPGVRSYSATALGPTGSGVLTLVWAILAGVLLAVVVEPVPSSGLSLLPWAALVLPAVAGAGYLSGRAAAWDMSLAMLFLIVLYAGLVVSGVFA